ncbi:MAG: DUF5655 domain-containing protein [Gemmatimonadales bacterium]
MPLFSVVKDRVEPVPQDNFRTEKELQALVEQNLDRIFKCRFVATEFSTGAQHAGRIDTLALSEENNPVIIEYKKVESSELVNQSLYYLSWLNDHRGDFTMAVHKELGPKVVVDWSTIRVICIAPNYRKYDLHAVKMMDTSIELWEYRRFANDSFYLEERYPAGSNADDTHDRAAGEVGKNPVMVAAGKKAAITRRTATWTFEQHIDNKPQAIRDLTLSIHDFITGLSTSIEYAPKKQYIAYRTTQNIVCVEVQQKKICLFLKLDPRKDKGPEGISRNVTDIGHFGTGDLEITIHTPEEFERTKPWIVKAYESLGG